MADWATRHSQESIAEFPLEMAEFRNVLQKAPNPIPAASTRRSAFPPVPAPAPPSGPLSQRRHTVRRQSVSQSVSGRSEMTAKRDDMNRPKRFVAQSTVGERTYGCAAIPPNTVAGRWHTSVLERG